MILQGLTHFWTGFLDHSDSGEKSNRHAHFFSIFPSGLHFWKTCLLVLSDFHPANFLQGELTSFGM